MLFGKQRGASNPPSLSIDMSRRDSSAESALAEVESRLESGQSRVRVSIMALIWIWIFSIFLHERLVDGGVETQHPGVFAIGALYSAYSLFHWAWVVRRPGYNPLRRGIVAVGDQAAAAVSMFFSGIPWLVFMFVSPWVSIGNGLRFGRFWMALSASSACLFISMVGLFAPYWRDHFPIVIGMVLLNAALPAYLDSLLKTLREARERLTRFADEMQRMAMRDALTGLPNRAALFGAIETASSLASRQNRPLALLYFDLDGFKGVNDSLGHDAGDELLRETAARVSEALRAEDVVSRLGGDEFVVLLQGLDTPDRADLVADRILREISSIRQIHGQPVAVSASIGGVVAAGAEALRSSSEALLKAADANMYQAKKTGKNRVVLTREMAIVS